MITIHYRPLANRRAYESIKLPVVPAIRFVEQVGRGYGKTAARGRPDPLGDAVARGGLDAVRAAQDIAAKRLGLRPAPSTTREIPIAVDATLPAVSAALERLERELAAMGLAHQAARCRAIGLAVGTVTEDLRSLTTSSIVRALGDG